MRKIRWVPNGSHLDQMSAWGTMFTIHQPATRRPRHVLSFMWIFVFLSAKSSLFMSVAIVPIVIAPTEPVMLQPWLRLTWYNCVATNVVFPQGNGA